MTPNSPTTTNATTRPSRIEVPATHADIVLEHVRDVGADHDQLAVGHVDDAHLAVREGQSEGDEQQDGGDAQTDVDLFEGRRDREGEHE